MVHTDNAYDERWIELAQDHVSCQALVMQC
jgi:hypothetical protein